MSSSDDFNLDEKFNGTTVSIGNGSESNNHESREEMSQEEIDNKPLKKSEVPKESQIQLDEQTLFQFSCYTKNEKICLKLREIGAFAPFIYIKKITLEGFKKIHPMFRSCDDLKTVEKHINKLFHDKKIELKPPQKKNDPINFIIKAGNISEEVTIPISGERMITSKKDEALLKLYEIQKDQIKLLDEIKKYIESKEKNGNEIINKIKKII